MNDKELGKIMYDKAVEFVNKRFPTDWGGCAIMYTEDGRFLISVALESFNAAACLCMETGAMCEAQKYNLKITHSLCLSRDNENAPFKILTACGICQERLRYWGEEVKVAISNPENAIVFKTLRELNPCYWGNAFDKKDREEYEESSLIVSCMLRPLCETDAEFLCSIFKDNEEYYNIFYDSESSVFEWGNRVRHFIKQEKIHHFIIEMNAEKVGWLSYEDMEDGERGIGILVIAKEYLHCGYGTTGLLAFLEKCKNENVHTVYLSVNQDNERAIRFYKKLGFEIYEEEIIPQCNEAINLAQYKMKLDI